MVYYSDRKFNGKIYKFLDETTDLTKALKWIMNVENGGNFSRMIKSKKLGKIHYRIYYRRKMKLSDFKRSEKAGYKW